MDWFLTEVEGWWLRVSGWRWFRPAAASVGLLLFCYVAFVHQTEVTEVGIERNMFTAELSLDMPGWNITAPWILVAKMDTHPMRVCVLSSGRGYSCKLVQFVPAHFKDFVQTEGFRYYWWGNRISFNSGYETYRGTADLLRGYAYGQQSYPFVRIIKE